MNFFNRFDFFLTQELSVQSPQKILVAVSGGIDSMVLLHLFMQTNHTLSVAHFNFGLRGDESDGDQAFVQKFCAENKIPFFEKKVDTKKFTSENKIGIQEAARILRYEWFNELSITNHFNFIATAHHLNDVTETLLFNISRGTGISGIHGIPKKNNQIIRPLLFATKNEIIEFAKSNSILFRSDSSNEKNIYARNKIRNQVIPLLKEINPLLEEHVQLLTNQIQFIEPIYRDHIAEIWEKIHQIKNEIIEIRIDELMSLKNLNFYLFEFLHPFNFNFSQVNEIIASIDEQSGKRFISSSHLLLKDREYLFISPLLIDQTENLFLEKETTYIDLNFSGLKVEHLKNIKEIIYSSNAFYFDSDTIEFPIKIRKWNTADRFFPLGMDSSKKVSDFFIDEKINLIDKSKAWICCSDNGNIICVLPYRIDNRYRITPQTKNILKFSLIHS